MLRKGQQHVHGSGPSSTPSSWEQVDAPGGGSTGADVPMEPSSGHVMKPTKGDPPRAPTKRSPTTRKSFPRRTPNGTQAPPDAPPAEALPEVPLPPFPSNSAEISLQAYASVEGHGCRGDSQWLPMSMREGQAFVPRDARTSKLEQEIEALKHSVDLSLRAHMTFHQPRRRVDRLLASKDTTFGS